MSARAFVDTNILVYAHDRLAGPKHLQARQLVGELWNSGGGILSTQVLQEFSLNVRRKVKHPLSMIEVRKAIEDYLSWEIVVNDGASILEALEIEQRFQVSFWDALIIQAAESAGADVVYSEDLSHRQKYRSLQVINPFLEGATHRATPQL
jgi:predicted nucleic acid-binding protein